MKISKGEGEVVAWIGFQEADEDLLHHILSIVVPRTDRDKEELAKAVLLVMRWFAENRSGSLH